MSKPTRRKFILGALGVVAAGGIIAWVRRNSVLRWAVLQNRNKNLHLTPAPEAGGDPCVLTADQVEGPFYVAAPNRRDLKEDRIGKDLKLRLQLVQMPGCTPLAGAIVQVWQCDAEGAYSGYPAEIAHDMWKTLMLIGTGDHPVPPLDEKRFLRGAQVTDANGHAEFSTIFPGWYEPRAPHIHFKIIAGGRISLTSQFYFEPSFSDRIYTRYAPYTRHGPCPFTPANDVAISEHQRAEGLLLNPAWNEHGAIEVSARIGIRAPA